MRKRSRVIKLKAFLLSLFSIFHFYPTLTAVISLPSLIRRLAILVSKPFVKLRGHLVLHLLWLFLFNFLPLKNKRSGEQMMVILQVSLNLKKDSFVFSNSV